MALPTIIARDLKVKQHGHYVLDGISFQLMPGQHMAIVGASGSGKTVLGKTLAGRLYHEGQLEINNSQPDERATVLFVEQRNEFKNLSNVASFYYQQRYNSTESEDALTLWEDVNQHVARYKLENTSDASPIDNWLKRLGLSHRRNTPLIQLSNGENKRLQLVKSLLAEPDVLVLDQPFTGLDAESRELVKQLITELSSHTTVILITSHHEFPNCITHIAHLKQGKLSEYVPRQAFHRGNDAESAFAVSGRMPSGGAEFQFNSAVYMRNASVTFGDKVLFEQVDWNVRKGDKWLLKGPNGSGKSTLLSLINGDNPQAYSNEIYLFDKRRGSGESIWDIKKKIGYVSPELHWYFDKTLYVYEAVASGFFDTMGLYSRMTPEQEESLVQWIACFKMNKYAFTLLSNLSAGHQRLVMLMRALVKNPPLLILDEPCQGLDNQQTADFIALVDEQCQDKTLIYVSHYDQEVPSCINRKLELRQGKAIQSIIDHNKTAVA